MVSGEVNKACLLTFLYDIDLLMHPVCTNHYD
jgi:hypothetical protein